MEVREGEKALSGALFLCGTPIGNLEDISLRVLRILKEADLIAAEDTRHTRKLLAHYDIHTKLLSYNEHNHAARGPELIEKMKSGSRVALVSDAGMPGISDPGEELVRLCIREEIPVTAVPGPSAVLLALASSGLSTRAFVFEGFIPRGGGKRKEFLENMALERRTIVLYESPRRLIKTIDEFIGALGDRQASLLREGTKLYEENLRGRLSEICLELGKRPEVRGECTLVIEGRAGEEKEADPQEIENLLRSLLAQGLSRKDAVSRAVEMSRMPRNEIYRLMLSL
ncbi:MAG: 16S rRNA (cytidine(1402)-2'-O)-methyltransferase [bacterium]